jgi:hypothetical protein
MTSLWKAVLGVILVFIFGFLAGVVSTSIVAEHKVADFLKHPGVGLMKVMEKRLTKGLELDDQQKKQIDDDFMENLRQHKQLQLQIQPQVQLLNQATVKQITATLRPDQQERFNKNLDDLRNRFWKYSSNPDTGNGYEPAAQPSAIGNGTNAAPRTPPLAK